MERVKLESDAHDESASSTPKLSASQLGAAPGIIDNQYWLLQSDGMNVKHEHGQQVPEAHGLASKTRENVWLKARNATEAAHEAHGRAKPTPTQGTGETTGSTGGGLASETREESRVLWVDLDSESDAEPTRRRAGLEPRPARVYSESQKRHRKEVRRTKKLAKKKEMRRRSPRELHGFPAVTVPLSRTLGFPALTRGRHLR